MKKLFSTLFVIISCITLSVAQIRVDDTTNEGGIRQGAKPKYVPSKKYESYKSLGVNFSSLGAVGFSYRQFNERLGLELTTLPVYSNGEMLFFSIGLSGCYKFMHTESFEVYHSIQGSIYIIDGGLDVLPSAGYMIGIESNGNSLIGAKFGVGYGGYNIGNRITTFPAAEFGLYLRLKKD